MDHLPIFVTLRGRPVLMVGGGELAARKLRLILKAGAEVTVVAPSVTPEIAALAAEGRLRIARRPFRAEDVTGAALVYAATDIETVDTAVAEAAREAGMPVNAVDRPGISTFITPAMVDRDPIVVAISSAGSAPVLARRIRERLETMLPRDLGRLARFADSFRGALKASQPDGRARRRFWERFFDGPVAARVLAGDETGARERMVSLINRPRDEDGGRVTLVGAGPGDPDLLTFRAMRALQEADVIVHDRLVGPGILEYARRDADRIYVGKTKGDHAVPQDRIHQVMLEAARAGQHVVRLKGGDPFVFGRGGEEMEYLERHGVTVEVVPGVTAAIGCAAATAMPLTHRDHAQAVTFVTGHARDGAEPDLDWAALARLDQTLAIYMGVSTAGTIAGRLIDHGMARSTPVTVVENGTRPEQLVVKATLATVAQRIVERGVTGPAMLVVGSVAALARGETPPAALAEAV